MGQYQTLGALAAFLLFTGFIVGQGAGDYVEYGEVPSENLTQEDLNIPLAEYDASRYTYYSDGSIVVNQTAWANRGALDPDIANVEYNPNLENIETIVLEVSIPENHTGGMTIGQGLVVRPLTDGVNRVENLRNQDAQFRVRWEIEDSSDSTLNATLDNAYLSTEPVESSGFVENIQSLLSITTGYPFFNQVILGVITLVLGLILLGAVTDSLPFF